jgi:hypothetical protein
LGEDFGWFHNITFGNFAFGRQIFKLTIEKLFESTSDKIETIFLEFLVKAKLEKVVKVIINLKHI